MRKTLLLLSLLLVAVLDAAPVTVHISAPSYAGQRVFLYRYLDLFTLRQERVADAFLNDQGIAELAADVIGTQKATVRIGEVSGDLFLRAGSYHVGVPALPAGTPRSMNGTAKVALDLTDIDALDVNMLSTDLYERMDAFVAEGLMASRTVAHPEVPNDSLHQVATRFINSPAHEARIDTFAKKMHRFYAEIDDPWFQAELEYGLASLHLGPRANDKVLFERYLKGRPIAYDVPEYVRFLGSFFSEHFMRFPFRSNEALLTRYIRNASIDSLKSLLGRHDFLRDNDRLTELVMITELYANHWGQLFDRDGSRRILEETAARSAYTEHRTIASDMLWDLTAMKVGAKLPSLRLSDAKGDVQVLDSLLTGPVLLIVTADWCTRCEQEMAALEQLYAAHAGHVRFIGITLTEDPGTLARYIKAHPQRNWDWFFAGDDGSVLEALRTRSIPALYLLNGKVLTHAPAPTPMEGLGPILHAMKVRGQEERRIRPDRGIPPKR